MTDEKKFCFGFEVGSPWPELFPNGKRIEESLRYMAVASLGNVSQKRVLELIDEMPRPPFKIGAVGIFDNCLFLHEAQSDAKTVAWKGISIGEDQITPYGQALSDFFRERGLSLKEEPFFPHVTVAKSLFKKEAWEAHFRPLPYQVKALHLYENPLSLSDVPIWSLSFLPPFDPIDHTADIAFEVRGENVNQLYMHAQMALAFECPELVPYLDTESQVSKLEEVIMKLNEVVTRADQEIGVPLKAVSFHGNLIEKNQIFTWEMIVDV